MTNATRTPSGYFSMIERPKFSLHPEWRSIGFLFVGATGILLVALRAWGAL